MHDALREVGRWKGEILGMHKNGKEYPAWISVSAIRDNEGRVNQHVAIFSDITERKNAEELLKYRVYHDDLTGLPNRPLFLKRLSECLLRAKTYDSQLAVFFIDLDHFKWVNDNLGHDVGDLLLIEVTRRLRQCVRDTDLVARLSGDEFTIILSQVPKIQIAQSVAKRVVEILSRPFQLAGKKLTISASVGIAIYPKDGNDIQTLLKHADVAMYHAKSSGRNNYQFYEQCEI
jgi:diguanylate cyclase (GGDEF)-like protein